MIAPTRMRRRARTANRDCGASTWRVAVACVDRAGDGDESCPVCNRHMPMVHMPGVPREVRIPRHETLPPITEAVSL